MSSDETNDAVSLIRGALYELGSILAVTGALRWPSDQLYVQGSRAEWSMESPSAVVECDPYEEEPSTVMVDGVSLNHALTAFEVMDVVANMHGEGLDFTGERFVEALRYFHEYDSFLTAESER